MARYGLQLTLLICFIFACIWLPNLYMFEPWQNILIGVGIGSLILTEANEE